ncbi:hypothetical protein CTI12_AA523760 [Artemisia annua]|uniref:Pentatricopeptide repeat-containing protein n=1 Tax=Artemisia annua TaxID=35608 RepID=A0A2U1L6B1_ARTAN|nr:hypothetical protein CTI12_AA523760 [Artemisia annua]
MVPLPTTAIQHVPLFGEEDEDQALMFNSEDSNQSWREKNDKDDILASKKFQESLSLEDESFNPLENLDTKLNEAHERRERARRFVSFTSRMPDLQRTPIPGDNPSCSTRQNKGDRSKTSNPFLRHYCSFKEVELGKKVFDECVCKNVVCCTTLISGLFRNGCVEDARKVFGGMCVRNDVSYSAMVSGFVRNGCYH